MSVSPKVETMAKGDFARFIGVSPGRVSQYIAEGKIFGNALESEGRQARIRPDVARTQLVKTLEPSQRLGANGSVLRSVAEPATLPLEAPARESVPGRAAEPVHDELAAERLKQQRIKTAEAERKEALAAGRYMLTEEAQREMGRAVGEAFKIMDAGIREMSNALASEFGIQQRDAHQVMVKAFRDVRAKAAQGFRTGADAEPSMIVDADDDMKVAS